MGISRNKTGARRWLRLASDYLFAQAGIQLLGLATSLWLVNAMAVREYALYTLSLSAMTFLSVFSDLGIGSALVFFRRESERDGRAFHPYVAAALLLRRWLFAAGLAFVFAFLVRAGGDKGFAARELAVPIAIIGVALWFQIAAAIRLAQLRLEGAFRASYLADLAGNLARLASVAMLVWASWVTAAAAAIAHALGAFATRAAARPLEAASGASHEGTGNERRQIVRYILPLSLNAMYFSIQGPLTVWLAAFFASTATIAQVGALGRLGLLLGLVSGFAGTVFLPQLSRVADDAAYLRRYLAFWLLLLAIGAPVAALAHARPDWLLLLLGSEYSGLTDGVFIVACTAVVSTFGAYAVGVNHARGWVRLQPVALVLYATVQLWLVMHLDLSDAIGVLRFGLWSAVAGWLLQLALNAIGFVQVHRKRPLEPDPLASGGP